MWCQIFVLGTVGHMFAEELEIMTTPSISKPFDVLKSYLQQIQADTTVDMENQLFRDFFPTPTSISPSYYTQNVH